MLRSSEASRIPEMSNASGILRSEDSAQNDRPIT